MHAKLSARRRAYCAVMRALMVAAVVCTCGLMLLLIGYVMAMGIPHLSWTLLSTKPSYLTGAIGILPDMLNTIYLILGTLAFVLPLGVGAADI